VIQAFADKIVGMLMVRRSPERAGASLAPRIAGQSAAGIASEMISRAVGRRPLTKPAAGA